MATTQGSAVKKVETWINFWRWNAPLNPDKIPAFKKKVISEMFFGV